MDTEIIKSIASLISAIAWPLVALIFLYSFRSPLSRVVGGISEFKLFGIEAKIQKEIAGATEDVSKITGLSSSPSKSELIRSAKVADLASNVGKSFIWDQIDNLALQYEKVRASMPPGNERTIAMEAVVSQMRAMGQAAWTFRHELADSASPGRRLAAITSLQVQVDFDMLDWLASRVSLEKPFVSYHALVALNAGAKDKLASNYINVLNQSLQVVKSATASLASDTDRRLQIERLKANVKKVEEEKILTDTTCN